MNWKQRYAAYKAPWLRNISVYSDANKLDNDLSRALSNLKDYTDFNTRKKDHQTMIGLHHAVYVAADRRHEYQMMTSVRKPSRDKNYEFKDLRDKHRKLRDKWKKLKSAADMKAQFGQVKTRQQFVKLRNKPTTTTNTEPPQNPVQGQLFNDI